MPLLLPLLALPALAALVCLLTKSRRIMSVANVVAFGLCLVCGIRLLDAVLARQVVTEFEEFFRADALSALMVLLISVVSLGSSLYAGRYFGRDLAQGTITAGRVKEFFVLTPLFT